MACDSDSFFEKPSMNCPECGVKMERSVLTSTVFLIHAPADTKEVLRSLKCPLFGASTIPEIPATLPPEQKDDEVLDIPSIWRTTGHFNAMWNRSK
jgi:hypothetical protein